MYFKDYQREKINLKQIIKAWRAGRTWHRPKKPPAKINNSI
jgi:hypothetical protein